MRGDVLEFLPSRFFEDPVAAVQRLGGTTVKESRLRWAGIFSLSDGKKIFFKRDRTKGWVESLKYLLLPSKGQKEWLMSYQLQKRNLNIPKPLGWMERCHRGFVVESYYLSEAVGSGISFIEEAAALEKGPLIAELAKVTKKIHASGLFHKDLHAGNFLREGETFYLIDLHRAKIVRSLSLDQRLWNLAQLFYSLGSVWAEEDRSRFVERYLEGESPPWREGESCLRKIDSLMDDLQRRRWRSRTKRCLRESTEFSVDRGRRVLFFHRRDFSLDQIEKALENHLQVVKGNSAALKKLSPEVVVSLPNDHGDRVCIKQYRYPRFWDWLRERFRRPKGEKAWIAANGLRVRGIPSIKPLALVERRDWMGSGTSFFIMEALETGQEMDRSILKGFDTLGKKRFFLKSFARWLSHFHRMNLYHKDMKTCNILVSKEDEDWDFRLLDLEDVRLDRRVDEKRLFRNLLQLNTSTPKSMTRTDRIRFFREYLKSNPIVRDQKAFLKRLVKESRRRGMVYVSLDGVVQEPM